MVGFNKVEKFTPDLTGEQQSEPLNLAKSDAGSNEKSSNRVLGLDGLRAISIMLVLIGHYIGTIPQIKDLARIIPPTFGVSVFFVVSGFLIAGLLIKEYKATSNINVKQFYIRRFLRLSPSLYTYLAFFSVLFFTYDGQLRSTEILSSFVYVSNYYYVHVGQTNYYIPTWSLSVEEHFYLLFPSIFLMSIRKSDKTAVTVILVAIVIVAIWRMICFSYFGVNWHDIYERTDTRIDTILFGCVAACFAYMPQFADVFRRVLRTETFLAALALIAFSILYRDETFRSTWRFVIQGVSLAAVVSYITMSNAQTAGTIRLLLEKRLFVYVGKISYPLYLWHLTTLAFIARVFALSPVTAALWGIVLSFVLSALSYHVIENGFLSLRRKYGSHV
jgi:peptidoglycan/LPS O-acetylase OafA/YrhL